MSIEPSESTSDPPRTVVTVDLGARTYQIVIATGALATVASTVRMWGARVGGWPADGRLAAIVTDENVVPHAEVVATSFSSDGWRVGLIKMSPGEPSKSQPVITRMYDELVAMEADRRSLIVAVGGGVVGDAAGFLAATYARGLPLLQIPTTLLADVDSSVGGKVGINHAQAKNLVGAFHQPIGVFIDTETLGTLPDREYVSGMAEVVKYGVVLDARFFEYLEEHVDGLNRRDPDVLQFVIARSCRLKADVVEQDEFERTGLRAVLNYGHTFAHAFEAVAGYGEMLHGEAVAVGMVYASRLAAQRGQIDDSITQRQEQLLKALRLPISLPRDGNWPVDDVLQRMRLDKKSLGGRIRFILPTRLGHVELFDDVPADDVRRVLEETQR